MKNPGICVTLAIAITVLGFACGETAQEDLNEGNNQQNLNEGNNEEETDSKKTDEGDSEQGTSTNDTENTDSGDTVSATIKVPADFSCVPERLNTVYYTSPTVVGVPSGMGDTISSPDLNAGQEFALETTQAGLEGTYYLAVVVYCEGGGAADRTFPTSDVDWLGISQNPAALGPGTGNVNAGEIEVAVFNLGGIVNTTGTDSAADPNDKVKASVNVPADFSCVPTHISTVFNETPEISGIPSAIGDIIQAPELVAGEKYDIEIGQPGSEGEYYFGVIVYCEGGNGILPASGIDWIGVTSSAIGVGPGTGTVDAGEISIALY